MRRYLNMLGLAVRAGKVTSGEKASLQAIRNGTACLVILDRAAAKNAEKSITDACKWHEVPLVLTEENELGHAIGKPGRMVAAVTDPPLADRINLLAKADL